MVELRDRMPISEFRNWIAFYDREPFGFPVHNAMHGRLLWGLTKRGSPRTWMIKTSPTEKQVKRAEALTTPAAQQTYLRSLGFKVKDTPSRD